MRIIYKERIEGDVWKQRSINIGRGKFQAALIDIIDEEMDARGGIVQWASIIWTSSDITYWFKKQLEKIGR